MIRFGWTLLVLLCGFAAWLVVPGHARERRSEARPPSPDSTPVTAQLRMVHTACRLQHEARSNAAGTPLAVDSLVYLDQSRKSKNGFVPVRYGKQWGWVQRTALWKLARVLPGREFSWGSLPFTVSTRFQFASILECRSNGRCCLTYTALDSRQGLLVYHIRCGRYRLQGNKLSLHLLATWRVERNLETGSVQASRQADEKSRVQFTVVRGRDVLSGKIRLGLVNRRLEQRISGDRARGLPWTLVSAFEAGQLFPVWLYRGKLQ